MPMLRPLTSLLLVTALTLKWVSSTTTMSTRTEKRVASFVKIDGLLGLGKRQEEVCSIPGGPICNALTCCAPGQQCCPNGGCCEDTEVCLQDGCCPATDQICPGGPGCCPPNMTCCGVNCCASGEFCERGHCFDNKLKNSVARFTLDPAKNKELLENMCEGMKRGNGGVQRNAEVLTYRGKEDGGEPRGPIRRAAGCVNGYCRSAENNGNNPSFNSCDEYPPASTLEGGDSRAENERIIVCLPAVQNSRQGWMFSSMLRAFKSANGREMMMGEQFVISIDCDNVNPEVSKRAETVTSSGSGVVDSDLKTAGVDGNYVLVSLGDVAAGSYTVYIKATMGSTTGGFVFDNEGDAVFANVSAGLTAGQSQPYSFVFSDDMFGVAIALTTENNGTAVTWSLSGTTIAPSSSSTTSMATSPPPLLSSATRIPSFWAALVAVHVTSLGFFIVF